MTTLPPNRAQKGENIFAYQKKTLSGALSAQWTLLHHSFVQTEDAHAIAASSF